MSSVSAAAAAVITAAAVAVANANRVAVTTVGIRNDIGGDRFGSAQPPNEFSSLGLLICRNKCVLVCLRCRKLESLVLVSESLELVINHEVHQTSVICVLVVDDVSCGVLNGVAEITETSGHVVLDRVKISVGGAAAVGYLVAEVADASVYTVETGADSIVESIGAVTDALLHTSDGAVNVLNSKAVVKLGTGQCAIHHHAAPTAAKAAKAAAPASTKTKHGEYDNGPYAISPTAKASIIALALAHHVAEGEVAGIFAHIKRLLSSFIHNQAVRSRCVLCREAF